MGTRLQEAAKTKQVVVTIYPIAGRQLFFRMPERFCRECDLTVRAVRQVVEALGNPPQVQIRVRPWLNYLPQALLRGGWHPPVVTINGKRFSQGVVPNAKTLKEGIVQLLKDRGGKHGS